MTLTDLGFQQQTRRYIGGIEIICLGWNICNSWSGVAATMALAITQGGSITLIYGVILIFFVLGCTVATLAELASVYPTAGGQ
jgi:choline transport protein